MSLFAIIGVPLGWIMYLIYQVIPNYGVTLIVFSLLVKVVMIPLAVKQQKGLISNARVQPRMAEIQKKYANNRERMMEELNKLYAEENYSPVSSCLPLLIQFPILFGLIDVIYYPIKHMLRLPTDVIAKAINIAEQILTPAGMNRYSKEISVLNAVHIDPQAFIDGIGAEYAGQLSGFDFSMFGLGLGDTPRLLPGDMDFQLYLVLLMIPILSGVISLFMSMASMKTQKATMGDSGGQAAAMTGSMLLLMPLMSIWISFQVPAGVGIYWLISNAFMCVQTMVLNKIMNPAEEIAKAKKAAEELRERERQERIEAKKKAREEGTSIDTKKLSQKELNRQKLAAARKRLAEKYGEEYVEAADEDAKG